jgi:hypothetical protein
MSAIAHKPAAFSVRLGTKPFAEAAVPGYLRLRPTEDGWSLIGTAGDIVFHALGPRGRRQCLEYARAHGIVAVLS